MLGYERQKREKSAGIRTHLLVSLGACLFTLASISIGSMGNVANQDPGRIAAQVVSGIGFLCGGVIMRDSDRITGLTTATTIWLAAAIGVLCGSHMYVLAISATCLTLFFLILGRLVSHIIKASMYDWILEIRLKNPKMVNLEVFIESLSYNLQQQKNLKLLDSSALSGDLIKFIVNYRGSSSILYNIVQRMMPLDIDYDLDIVARPKNHIDEFVEEYYH